MCVYVTYRVIRLYWVWRVFHSFFWASNGIIYRTYIGMLCCNCPSGPWSQCKMDYWLFFYNLSGCFVYRGGGDFGASVYIRLFRHSYYDTLSQTQAALFWWEHFYSFNTCMIWNAVMGLRPVGLICSPFKQPSWYLPYFLCCVFL